MSVDSDAVGDDEAAANDIKLSSAKADNDFSTSGPSSSSKSSSPITTTPLALLNTLTVTLPDDMEEF